MAVPLTFPLALGAALLFGPANMATAGGSGPASETDSGPVAEMVSFRLADGADPEAFLDAAAATEALLTGYNAVTARYLTQSEDGTWTDIVIWTDLATALRAAEDVMTTETFAAFGAMIDGTTISMQHVPILWQMDVGAK